MRWKLLIVGDTVRDVVIQYVISLMDLFGVEGC